MIGKYMTNLLLIAAVVHIFAEDYIKKIGYIPENDENKRQTQNNPTVFTEISKVLEING